VANDPVMGVMARWAVGEETTAGTPVTPTNLLEVLPGSDLGMAEEAVGAEGMSGTRSRKSERTRAGLQRISGRCIMEPNAAELALLLPWILGANASGTTYALAETLQPFTSELKKDNGTDGKVFTYAGCFVNKATFTSEPGAALRLELEVEAFTESVGTAATATSLTLNVATSPFIHSDTSAAVSIAGSAYPTSRVQITIDNQLDADRFLNSTTRAALPAKGRDITVSLGPPYGASTSLYPTAATLAAGVAVNVTYTNTVYAVSCLFSFVKVHFPRRTPPWNGREEFMLPLEGMAKETAATKELVVTLDSTP
jgi:hypothetical protein